jgi:hypothetical protein
MFHLFLLVRSVKALFRVILSLSKFDYRILHDSSVTFINGKMECGFGNYILLCGRCAPYLTMLHHSKSFSILGYGGQITVCELTI